MEIDFKSIRALSSPTRLKILRRVLEKESTTTQLSEELDRSKSTISSHLKELTEAGLVEKDQKKGRRRVVYSPTRKADAIVNGKERKVKFSIGSSVLTAVAGTFLIWKDFARKTAGEAVKAAPKASPQAGGGQMETFKAMDAANATREAANTTAQKAAEASHGMGLEQFFLFLGVGLLAVSASTLIYGIALNHLGSFDSEEETVEVK
ncbi:MAG: ArsR/SmtB family transcription factor [Candidatus Nanohalobium sp.]